MADDELDQALALQGRITAFVRAFGLHQPDRVTAAAGKPTITDRVGVAFYLLSTELRRPARVQR